MAAWHDAWHALRAFAGTRWGHAPRTRAALLAQQERRLQAFLRRELGGIPFYAQLDRSSLQALPVVDKAAMSTQFERFNRLGLTREQALAAAQRAEAGDPCGLPGDVSAGLSSGTSGTRGVFLVSPRERAVWAGVLLARVLTRADLRQMLTPWAPPLRVAFFLRADSALYRSVDGRRLHLHWLPLTLPADRRVAALHDLQPHVLVAPACVLGELARAQRAGALRIRPRQVISVAEVLEDDDADSVHAAWGVRPGQVYQCTEGFLGSTCSAGHVHLNEEHVCIEPEWLDAQHTRFRPVVTDFTRRTQAFVRFRLDDVLRPLARPCPCGRPSLALARIEGRADDCLWLPDARGELQPVFPDALRHAVANAQAGWPAAEALLDYRLQQLGERWQLRVRPGLPAARLQSLHAALRACCAAAGLRPPVIDDLAWMDEADTAKRRRIRCVHKPGTAVA